MKIYVNKYGEIKDVNSTSDNNLTLIEIDEKAIPSDWSVELLGEV